MVTSPRRTATSTQLLLIATRGTRCSTQLPRGYLCGSERSSLTLKWPVTDEESDGLESYVPSFLCGPSSRLRSNAGPIHTRSAGDHRESVGGRPPGSPRRRTSGHFHMWG